MTKSKEFKLYISREETINRIIQLVNKLKIQEIPGWEDINFEKISTIKKKNNIFDEELVVLLNELEQINQERKLKIKDERSLKSNSSSNNWRARIPEILKREIEDWEIIPKEILEIYATVTISSVMDHDKKEIIEFLGEIKEIPN